MPATRPTCTRTDVDGDEVPGLVDEIPVLAVAAALAEGTTTFAGAGELRVKETDRVATVSSELAALGADVAADGRRPRRHRRPAAHEARRSARTATTGWRWRWRWRRLAAGGETVIEGWEAVATSYPGFEEDLRSACRV